MKIEKIISYDCLYVSWKPFKSSLENSAFNGKYIGFEKKVENGTYAIYRIDWDPIEWAHYNLEM